MTAAVLIAAMLAALTLLDATGFGWVVALVVALGAWEWARLAHFPPAGSLAYAAVLAAIFVAASPLVGMLPPPDVWVDAVFAAAALFWVAAVPAWMRHGMHGAPRALLAAAGAIVLLPAAAAALLLGREALLGVLCLVWIADSTAYFVGRRLGRRRLAPSISPGKTLEGAAGGLAGAALYAIICLALVPEWNRLPVFPHWLLFVAGAIVLCVISIVGDLFESAVKRNAGAKDSGWLLPGHGGVLDRIDSATAVLPVAALMLRYGASAG